MGCVQAWWFGDHDGLLIERSDHRVRGSRLGLCIASFCFLGQEILFHIDFLYLGDGYRRYTTWGNPAMD